MAKCKDCNIPVGCGCSLIGGRCSACNYKYQEILKGNVVPQTK